MTRQDVAYLFYLIDWYAVKVIQSYSQVVETRFKLRPRWQVAALLVVNFLVNQLIIVLPRFSGASLSVWLIIMPIILVLITVVVSCVIAFVHLFLNPSGFADSINRGDAGPFNWALVLTGGSACFAGWWFCDAVSWVWGFFFLSVLSVVSFYIRNLGGPRQRKRKLTAEKTGRWALGAR